MARSLQEQRNAESVTGSSGNNTATQDLHLLYNNGVSVSLFGVFTWSKEEAGKKQQDNIDRRKDRT